MAVSAPEPALLVASILGRDLEAVDRAVAACAEQLGRLLFVSEPLPFAYTEYYKDELGAEPARRIIAFDRLGDSSQLPDIKRQTSRLEVTLSRAGAGRQLNIDPGLLGQDQLVLASTKPRGHRIHLGRGVHGDLMLLRGPDGYEPLPWTYPDYASPELRAVFGRLRELLLAARRRPAEVSS
jgi:hypothetical protein